MGPADDECQGDLSHSPALSDAELGSCLEELVRCTRCFCCATMQS